MTKIFGLISYPDNAKPYVTLAPTMEALIEPFSYSLSYADSRKQNPRTSKTLASTLNGTGSYWAMRTSHEAISAKQCQEYFKQLSEKKKEQFAAGECLFACIRLDDD